MTSPLTPRLALLALLTLPLAACEGGFGLDSLNPESQPEAEGHKGPPGVSPLEAPIETGAAEARAVSTAEATTYNTAAFSARGNEPFWAVDVAGNTAIYKTPDNQRGRAVQVNRLAFAKGVEYIGVLNGRPFVVNIRAAQCRDSMSGDRFPMTASLTVSGRTQTGCAGPASPEVAQAVAATKAPAPAEPRATARPAASTATATRPAARTSTTAPAATAPASATPTTPAGQTPAETTPETVTPPAAASDDRAATTPAAPETPAVVPAPSLSLPRTPPSVTPPATESGTGTDADAGNDVAPANGSDATE